MSDIIFFILFYENLCPLFHNVILQIHLFSHFLDNSGKERKAGSDISTMTEWVISLFCLLWLTPNSTSAGGSVKNLQCKRRRFSPWVRRSPGGGHGKTVQYFCLENSMGRGAWRARVRGHTRTQSRLKWLSTARTQRHTMGQKGLCTSYQDPQKVSTHTHFWKWADRNSVVAVRLTGQACPNFTQPHQRKEIWRVQNWVHTHGHLCGRVPRSPAFLREEPGTTQKQDGWWVWMTGEEGMGPDGTLSPGRHWNGWALAAEVFPAGSNSKEFACNTGDPGSILGLGKSPGEENGNPLQLSCLGNLRDRGA